MIPWEKRPVEIANLLNPAFCGEVLRRSIAKYQVTSSHPFPYPFAFLVLPIVLHRKTRESIPTSARKQMHSWLMENQDIKIGFAERAKNLIQITKETITFLLQIGTLKMNKQGLIITPDYRPCNISGQNVGEVHDCYKKAETIGQMFARAGSPTTIYIMWGVKP
jgi:hypothetical protein